MKVENVALAGAPAPRAETPAEATDRSRKEIRQGDAAVAEQEEKSDASVHSAEILDKIKTLTQDGAYSVRFEMHDKTRQLVVRLVDAENGEVIRQLPPEEMLGLAVRLEELRGNIVNTKS